MLLSGTAGPLDAARVGGIAASVLGLAAFWLGSFDDRATAAAHVQRLRVALGRS